MTDSTEVPLRSPESELNTRCAEVDFLFSPHVYANDAELFADLITQDYDAVIFEQPGWTEQILSDWQAISDGDEVILHKHTDFLTNTSNMAAKDYTAEKVRLLFNSGKRVFFADVQGEANVRRIDIAMSDLGTHEAEMQMDFEKTLQWISKQSQEAAQMHVEREVIIREQIADAAKTLLSEEIERPKILVVFGSSHAAIADEVGYPQDSPLQIGNIFGLDGLIESVQTRILVKMQRGEEVDRSMLVDALMERFALRANNLGMLVVSKKCRNSAEFAHALNVVVGSVDEPLVRNIYDAMHEERHAVPEVMRHLAKTSFNPLLTRSINEMRGVQPNNQKQNKKRR